MCISRRKERRSRLRENISAHADTDERCCQGTRSGKSGPPRSCICTTTVTSWRCILHNFVISFGLRTFGRTNGLQIRSAYLPSRRLSYSADQRGPWASHSDGPSPPTRHSIGRSLLEMNDSKWPVGSPSISQLQRTVESPKPKPQDPSLCHLLPHLRYYGHFRCRHLSSASASGGYAPGHPSKHGESLAKHTRPVNSTLAVVYALCLYIPYSSGTHRATYSRSSLALHHT